jgi:hypothetical protein
MKVLFIAREGIDLLETLENSETSRLIFRFYNPQRHSCGVQIMVSSLGIALSLVSELRWYVRRYMKEVLFEYRNEMYMTHSLAQQVYQRHILMDSENVHRCLYGIEGGRIRSRREISPGHLKDEYISEMGLVEMVLEVCAPSGEDLDLSVEESTGFDENPLIEES